MSTAWEEMERQRRDHQNQYAWVHMLDGLRDWLRVTGVDRETDEKLQAMADDFVLEWITGPQAEGPQGIVLQTFRENAALWLSACPAEKVVVMPREIFDRIIAALPQLDGPLSGLPAMTADEWARTCHEQLANYADMRRHHRERSERERGSASADRKENTNG